MRLSNSVTTTKLVVMEPGIQAQNLNHYTRVSRHYLHQQYLEYLFKMQILQAHSRPVESEFLGVGSRNHISIRYPR